MVYNETWKKYLQTYKEKHLDALKEYNRKRAFEKYNSDPEYRELRKAQIKLNNDKKKQKKIDSKVPTKTTWKAPKTTTSINCF